MGRLVRATATQASEIDSFQKGCLNIAVSDPTDVEEAPAWI